MELVLGITAELQPGPYIDCPEEGCAYTLDHGVLMRHQRNGDLVFGAEPIAIDSELDAPDHERPRLRRIARMLAESAAAARLASPFVVFVPCVDDLATNCIMAGSGIVGAPLPTAERVVVYYEGGRYQSPATARLADRVFYAHGRLVTRSSSVAMGAFRRTSLIEVATFDPPSGTITPIDATSEAALAGWLGAEELDADELVRSGGAS